MKKGKSRYTNIMAICVFISIIVHSFAVFSLHKHLLAFSLVTKYFSLNKENKKNNVIHKLKEEDILVFTFDKEINIDNADTENKDMLSPQIEKYEDKTFSYNLQEQEIFYHLTSNYFCAPSFNQNAEELIRQEMTAISSSYSLKKEDHSSIFMDNIKAINPEVKKKIVEEKQDYKKHDHSPEKDRLCNYSATESMNFENREKNVLLTKPYVTFDADSKDHKKAISDYLLKLTHSKEELKDGGVISTPFLPFFPHIPSLNELNTITCGDDFDVDIQYIPREDKLGYVFALTLIPREDREFKKIKQNFYYLIDKSNSIQSMRYTSARQAVISSIGAMNKSDTFNISTFDNKLAILFKNNNYPSHANVTMAKNFLLSQKMGTFFISKNFSLPFNEMLGNSIDDEQINNIVLISNGEDWDKQKNCKFISDWSSINNRRQSLYILALEGDKNLPIMELFASKNDGQLLVSHTVKGMRKNLVRLVKGLNNPVAKNVSVTTYDDNNTYIELYPSGKKQSHLYYDQPYVIMGTVKSLDDFVVFIQGKNTEKWFNIKKEISFSQARKGGSALAEKWAQYRANTLYDGYLIDGEVDRLRHAEDILVPHNLTPAFAE